MTKVLFLIAVSHYVSYISYSQTAQEISLESMMYSDTTQYWIDKAQPAPAPHTHPGKAVEGKFRWQAESATPRERWRWEKAHFTYVTEV